MKRNELSETYIGSDGAVKEGVRMSWGRTDGTDGWQKRQMADGTIDHFVIENGIMIPWDIAMDPKRKLEYVQSELKKAEAEARALEAELKVKQYEELEKLKPNISDILWVAGIAMAIALIFIL